MYIDTYIMIYRENKIKERGANFLTAVVQYYNNSTLYVL